MFYKQYQLDLEKATVLQSTNFKIGLLGKVKPKSRLGFVVGSEIEVAWEVTNLDPRPFSGGTLLITMSPANGQYVQFGYEVNPLQPNEKMLIDKTPNGTPLTTNVIASGFTLFSARMDNVDIYSPPTEYRHPQTSFLSFLGKSKEEVYSLFALILAAIGLVGTFITSLIQLLIYFHAI